MTSEARRSSSRAEPRHLAQLRSALEAASISEDRFFEVAATAVTALRRTVLVSDPSTQFSESEREALTAGGLDLSTRREREPDPIADTAARYSALLADSADVAEVAATLGVTRARVRQRAVARTLFAIREGDEWRFPRAQFEDGAPLRGLSIVVSALAHDLHPVAAWRFLTEPNVDLELDDEAVSPLTWVRSGGSADCVAAIARDV